MTVPDVRNKTLDQAKADIQAAGLTPGTETRENSPSVAADTVLGTTPEAGTAAEAGSTVDFRISSGLVTLTDLTGQTLSRGILVPLGREPAADAGAEARPGVRVAAGLAGRRSSRCRPATCRSGSEVELTYCAG